MTSVFIIGYDIIREQGQKHLEQSQQEMQVNQASINNHRSSNG